MFFLAGGGWWHVLVKPKQPRVPLGAMRVMMMRFTAILFYVPTLQIVGTRIPTSFSLFQNKKSAQVETNARLDR